MGSCVLVDWLTKRQDNIKTALGSQDLALLDPERDLSIKVKNNVSLKFNLRSQASYRAQGFVLFVWLEKCDSGGINKAWKSTSH